MLEFINKHYIIIMIVSLFLIFALIGYLIDSSRIRKRNNEEVLEEEAVVPNVIEEVAQETVVPNITELVVEEQVPPIDTLEIVPPVAPSTIPKIEEPEDNV